MSIRQPLPDDYEEMDFRIIDEGWNRYDLEDGTQIRARSLITKIIRNPNAPENFSFDLMPPIYAVSAPPANRGPNDNVPTPDQYRNLHTIEVRTTENNEFWNRYEIQRTGQVVRFRLMVSRIRRAVDRFDQYGLPFYLVDAQPTIMVDPRPGLQPQ